MLCFLAGVSLSPFEFYGFTLRDTAYEADQLFGPGLAFTNGFKDASRIWKISKDKPWSLVVDGLSLVKKNGHMTLRASYIQFGEVAYWEPERRNAPLAKLNSQKKGFWTLQRMMSSESQITKAFQKLGFKVERQYSKESDTTSVSIERTEHHIQRTCDVSFHKGHIFLVNLVSLDLDHLN